MGLVLLSRTADVFLQHKLCHEYVFSVRDGKHVVLADKERFHTPAPTLRPADGETAFGFSATDDGVAGEDGPDARRTSAYGNRAIPLLAPVGAQVARRSRGGRRAASQPPKMERR